MIVFDGCLTDEAEKYFINKLLNNFTKILIIMLLFSIPIWAFLSSQVGAFIEVMIAIFVLILFSPLIFRLCVTKKERQKNTPKKVIIAEGVVTSISSKTTISKNVEEIKEVHDYDQFYYLVLPKRYVDSVFVCQKDLLVKGSLEEFEKLFEGRIIRKQKSQDR